MGRPTAPGTTGGPLRHAFPVMGTVCSIVVCGGDVAALGTAAVRAALAAAAADLDEREQRFSHYRPDSDIERWARGEPVPPAARAEIDHVLSECDRLRDESGGAFAVTDPRTGRLDTAGFVKGYAIRRAVGVLRDGGLTGFTIGVGGDVYAAGRPGAGGTVASGPGTGGRLGDGRPDDGRPWRVAIADPRRRGSVAAVVEVADAAVATSGRAERGDHIWLGSDPSPSNLVSLTVVGPDIALADAFATIGFALGEAGIDWVARQDGYRSLAIRPDGVLLGDAVTL